MPNIDSNQNNIVFESNERIEVKKKGRNKRSLTEENKIEIL